MSNELPSAPADLNAKPARFDRFVSEALATPGQAPQSGLRRTACTTLQLNVTTRCNLACHHCHVESGPKRTEAMDARVIARVIEVLAKNPQLTTLDLTGGAPEMSEHFRELVTEARKLGRRVIDRCNLTILFEPGQQDTAQFLADQGVEIIASLPCYTAENVENQRGRGVFNKSIEGLRMLCALGYGKPDNGLKLDLVYNPGGAFLPPSQAELELEYRDELSTRFDITFNNLLTITNMPIKRFAHDLERTGQVSEYMSLLVNHFNPRTVEALMCRETLSVAYDGSLFDCDFNQALAIPIGANIKSIFDLDTVDGLEGQIVATDEHCFGCTAGAGSSCGGALKENG
ncbi:MAG: arsenosugar biosynthesis radical SAM protein ArsS [Myxococcota bacterium]